MVPDQKVLSGTATNPQAFLLSDADTDLTKLTVTASSDNKSLVPDANIRVTGLAATRTVVVKPAFSSSGTANITLTVSDGSGFASRKFKVTFADPAAGGLYAEYFKGTTLAGVPVLTRLDPTVNFDWSATGPDTSVGEANYSVRWSGYFIPAKTESVTFYTTSDDGVRLWINGALVIDNWKAHTSTENTSAAIKFTADRLTTIRMEYYQGTGPATATLSWSSPSIPKAIIPSTALLSLR